MSVAAAEKPKPAVAFPAADVEACLTEELLEAVRVEASLRGLPIPTSPAAAAARVVEMDSLVVVDLLCAVEPVLGFKLPQGVVRAGGYHSVNQAVAHLMPRIEREWSRRRGGKS
jgi:hypothetical protein